MVILSQLIYTTPYYPVIGTTSRKGATPQIHQNSPIHQCCCNFFIVFLHFSVSTDTQYIPWLLLAKCAPTHVPNMFVKHVTKSPSLCFMKLSLLPQTIVVECWPPEFGLQTVCGVVKVKIWKICTKGLICLKRNMEP